MTDKQQPEALRLAKMLTANEWPGHVTLVSYARECVAELRRIHAYCQELESQLAQRFDATDMATAAAQGFRDGVASLTAQAADSVPAVEREQERIAFKDAHRHLELGEVPDAWGRPMFTHSHVEASWLGWIARASRGQAPAGAAEELALTRHTNLAVVQRLQAKINALEAELDASRKAESQNHVCGRG